MHAGVFRFLAVCLVVFSMVALAGCKARQAASSDALAGGVNADRNAAYDGNSAPQDSGLPIDEAVMPGGGRVSDNELSFGQGQRARCVYGVYVESRSDAINNRLNISGGEIADSAYGAFTEGRAMRNKVTVMGGKIGRRVEGGHGREGSTENELIFAGGSVENAYGGYSSDGPADNNRLVVRGGLITDDAQAGLSLRSSASGNTLVVEGGVIEDQAYGGYGMEGPATGNTTIVSGGVIKGDAQGAVSSTHQATGNTLILRGSPQIGGSLYGAFAVSEHGDSPDDITGNKILFEGFTGALGDIWNAEEVRIDAKSRIANRERVLNFYACRQVKNDGIIAAAQGEKIHLMVDSYSGKGGFELEPGAALVLELKELNAPLRLKIKADGQLRPFSRLPVVDLQAGALGKGMTYDNAVQLLDGKAGGLILRLEREQDGSGYLWYLSGE